MTRRATYHQQQHQQHFSIGLVPEITGQSTRPIAVLASPPIVAIGPAPSVNLPWGLAAAAPCHSTFASADLGFPGASVVGQLCRRYCAICCGRHSPPLHELCVWVWVDGFGCRRARNLACLLWLGCSTKFSFQTTPCDDDGIDALLQP